MPRGGDIPAAAEPDDPVPNGLNLLLDKAIVVWDEAHNVPGAAREAATLLRDAVGLRALCEGLDEMRDALASVHDSVVPDKKTHLLTVSKLRAIASQLRGWLLEQVKEEASGTWTADSAQGDDSVQAWTRHGAAAVNVVSHVLGLSAASLQGLRLQVRQMRAALIVANFESSAVKSTAINDVEEIITKLEMMMTAEPGDFRLVVRRFNVASRRRAAAAGASPPMPSVLFACMLGGVALAPLREATRCMLFASGTLGPPILLTSELQLGNNCVAVSTEHHATIAAQLRLLVINSGRDVQGASRLLETQLCNRGDGLYEALGTTILKLLKSIPGGCLVFWPSQSMMMAALDRWSDPGCGILDDLRALVPTIEIDGPRLSAEQSKAAMGRYRAAAAASRGASCGALLLAVMRGRASEGTDFKDQAARGVIVVGLPLPPCYDAAVSMKRAYNDARWRPARCAGPARRRRVVRQRRRALRLAGHWPRHSPRGRLRHCHPAGLPVRHRRRDAVQQRRARAARLLPRYTRSLLRGAHDAEEATHILQPFFAERRAQGAQ